MRNNKNKIVFNDKHLQNIKRKIEEKTGVQFNQNNENENEMFKPVRILRKPAAIIALMICFVMLASAAAAVIYQTQYIPLKGFVESGEGEYEVYCTPEILKLGKNATVETVTRVKDGKTSNLSIIITDTLEQNIKIITEKHGEFNLTSVIDYRYSSFGTMTAYSFEKDGGYTSYGYYIQNFPDINEFTLVSGNQSIEVKLVPSNSGGVVITENSGVKIKSYSMSKGSKVFAYEIYENNCDFAKILGTEFLYYETLELGSGAGTFKLYDENGNKIFLNGYDSNIGPDGLSTVMFLRTGRGDKISKMAVDSIRGSINTSMLRNNSSIEDVPVPADGEEIIFDGGLLLYDSNGLICKAESVTRKGNEVTIYTNTEYTGEYIDNIENIDIYMNWRSGLGVRVGGWMEFTTFSINGNEEFIKLYMDGINYRVNGNWEIIFE